jgi:hypothetical protein
MSDAELERLRREARAFDDDALVALANRGLVRRARRLIEDGPPQPMTAPDHVEVAGAGWTVRWSASEPITRGRCDCATAGICAHLIGAILTLQGDAAAPAAEPASVVGDALRALSDEELRRWAGATDLRWGIDRLASLGDDEVEIEDGRHVVVRLPSPLPTVRFMSATPDSLVVEPSGRHDRRTGALAILVLWRRADRLPPTLPERPLAVELTDERRAVATEIRTMTADAVRRGLLHLGATSIVQLDALAAGARGARLYRLAALLERAADEIEAIDGHRADADSARLLAVLAETDTVAEAVLVPLASRAPVPDALAGSARAGYESIGSVELAGCGHYRWGDAMFGGTTAVLCEASGSRIFTVTRVSTARGRRQEAAIGWEHAGAVASLAGTTFRLTGARASSELRLSTSAETTFSPLGPLSAAAFDAARWTGGSPPAASRLHGRTGRRWIVAAVEQAEDEARFDPIRQRLVWQVGAAARDVLVELPFTSHTTRAMDALARLVPSRPSHVVGRLEVGRDGPSLWPVSVVVDGDLQVLDDLPGAMVAVAADESAPHMPTHLDRVEAEVVHLAERGTAFADPAQLEAIVRRARDRGLTPLAAVLGDERASLEPRVLRTAWVLAEYRAVTTTGDEAEVDADAVAGTEGADG